MNDECANQFREKTSERVEKCLCENGGAHWNQVEKILRETALEVCGKKTAQVKPLDGRTSFRSQKAQRKYKRKTQKEKRSKKKGNR